jgi:predicted NAD-dependent protein-ADP-ribosyltransferase YbiA (DUF1768 family)
MAPSFAPLSLSLSLCVCVLFISRQIVAVFYRQKMKRFGSFSPVAFKDIPAQGKSLHTAERLFLFFHINCFKSLILYFKAKSQTPTEEKGKYQPFPD